ncbi:hypothetical protein TrVE_jg6039 [Triparma verrucosa]|nr:hypothetical protein TrVE_jg6039 [Triparma verrucosa]
MLRTLARRMATRGVVFDMDGTLTKAGSLDFKKMYDLAGVELSKDILAEVAAMPAAQRKEAMQAIVDVEREGALRMELNPGAVELATWLDVQGLPMAIVTRNSAATLTYFLEEMWDAPVNPALSRDGELDLGPTSTPLITKDAPAKPDPAAMLLIAKRWGVSPEEILMVGDSAANDVAFGNGAGSATALLDEGAAGRSSEERAAGKKTHEPTFTVKTLLELVPIIEAENNINK